MPRLLLSEAMIGVGLGLLIGVPVALAAAGYLAPYLYATNPRDPLALIFALPLSINGEGVGGEVRQRRASREF
jgi:hypothetical protein